MSSGGGGYGMAATIVGSELERWANILAADAMNEQFSSQMNLQNRFRQQGMQSFNQYIPGLSEESATKQMQQASLDRQKAYNQVATEALAPNTSMDKAVQAELGLQGKQRADVGSLGDWQTQQGIASSRFGDVINRISTRAKGAAQVFPYQMYSAQHSMDWLNMLGQMIAAIGGNSANFSNLSQQQGSYQPPASTGNVPNYQTQGLSPAYQQYLYSQQNPYLGSTTTSYMMGL